MKLKRLQNNFWSRLFFDYPITKKGGTIRVPFKEAARPVMGLVINI